MSELWTERVVYLHVMVFISIILDALSMDGISIIFNAQSRHKFPWNCISVAQ